MERTSGRIVAMASCLFMAVSIEAFAQQTTSFEQLQVLVKTGDKIFITDSNGARTEGKIESLTGSSLRVIHKGISRELRPSDISAIRKWRQDSLGNGAGIGLGAGLALGALSALAASDSCPGGCKAAVIASMGGIGAGIGIGIDALIKHKATVFSNRQTRKLHVEPILSRTSKGASLSLRF
jgi:hypothetical protein